MKSIIFQYSLVMHLHTCKNLGSYICSVLLSVSPGGSEEHAHTHTHTPLSLHNEVKNLHQLVHVYNHTAKFNLPDEKLNLQGVSTTVS